MYWAKLPKKVVEVDILVSHKVISIDYVQIGALLLIRDQITAAEKSQLYKIIQDPILSISTEERYTCVSVSTYM